MAKPPTLVWTALLCDGASLNHHESFLKLLIDGTSDVDKLLDELSQYPRREFQFTDQ